VGWSHNSHYHGTLLREVPPRCLRALDVGCGDGVFARELAGVAERVDAIDMDARAIARARHQPGLPTNVSFILADFLSCPIDTETYDFVSALASLHQMPFEPAIEKMTRALRSGGVLAVLGIWPIATTTDQMISGAAALANLGYRMVRGRDSMAAPSANPTMSLNEVRARIPGLLPGARVRRHLLWRYSLVWRKP
jgi:SAM-dependent methyltransferase